MTKKTKTVRASDECKNPDCRKMRKALARLTTAATGETPKQLYFDEKWLATRWGMSVRTIQKMRYAGKGPKPIMFDRAVRFRLRDVVAFERNLPKFGSQ